MLEQVIGGNDAFFELLPGLVPFLARAVLDFFSQRIPVTQDPVMHKTKFGTGNGVNRHQGRVGITFIEVIVDYAGVVQQQIAIHQRRCFVVRIQLGQVCGGRFVIGRVDDIDVDAFFCQYETNPVTVNITVSVYRAIVERFLNVVITNFLLLDYRAITRISRYLVNVAPVFRF